MMKLKPASTFTPIATSLLMPVAYAADQGGTTIEMVSIPGRNFEMGKTEVTQAQWQTVMGENPSFFGECGGDCPVEQVSWEDTKRFIKRLNKRTGKEYRLPSEEEWEYACRAGGDDTYCGGNSLVKPDWSKENSGGETGPVAGKQANAWGIYDISGNVWEWVEDKYDDTHEWRVLRGGMWLGDPELARAVIRIGDDPAKRFFNYGFRLARTLP